MATRVRIDFQFPDLIKAFDASWDRVERVVAATVQTQVGLRFDAEGAHNGHERWAPLKLRSGQILSLTGEMRKSIAPPGAPGTGGPAGGFVRSRGTAREMVVEVGTTLVKAAVHNKGAVILPKEKLALRFLNPNTGGYIFSKKSIIPARPFTDLNGQDMDEIEETLANLVASILSEAGL